MSSINNTFQPQSPLKSSLFAPPKTSFGGLFKGLSSPTSGLMPLTSNSAPKQTNAGNAFSNNGLNPSVKSSSNVIPTAHAETTGDLQNHITTIQNGVNQMAQDKSGTSMTNTTSGYQTAPNLTGNTQNNTSAPVRGLFPDIMASLARAGSAGTAQVQNANDELAKYRQSVAKKEADITATGADLNFKTGELGALQKLSAIGEQTRQQSVENTLAAQSNNISALGTAAGLAAPSVSSYGQTSFNPVTGSFSSGNGNLDPQTAASQLASKVISGQMTYDQAAASLGYAGTAGQQFLNNAIQQSSPNFNIPQANATVAGQQGVAQQVIGMQAANNAAKGIENTITGYLAQNPDLNPSKLAAGNFIAQWIQGKQLTDPKYQTLFNYLNEYISTLAPILGVGGDTTNLKTQIAQSFINAQASGESISQVLKSISSLADDKISNFQAGGTNGNQNQQSSGGGDSTTIGGTTFKLVNGQWVVA